MKQFVAEAKPNTARTFTSPRIDSIRPDTTFRALYYYNPVPTLTALATATCSTRSQCRPTLLPQAQSPWLPCLAHLNPGSRTKFNPGEHRPAFSSAATRLQAWTANDGGLSKLSLLLGVPWSRSLVQGLAGRGYCWLVDSSLSEKEEVQR
ncbi:hypothetical protein M405DRAFT_829055 [Rhizopogon salebrosus TDB-379]|nr:hypothetical protein M405DRAFT_829055 [Rhizopogon salebrosus TDB-379]